MKQGWEIKSLSEIADVEYGFTDKSEEEGDYRYVRITDIDSNGELISTEKKYLKYSKEAEGFLIRDKDLLMARTGATFAKVLIYQDFEPSVFASYLIRIKFKEKFENKLYWYFTKTKSYWEQANSLASGAAQPHFNGAAVKQVVFSYPKSIQEQQRIVAILDEAFATIAKAKANAEQNLKNAKELFESYLQGVFENNGEGWEEKTLGEIADVEYGYTDKSTEEGDYRYIRITDIDKNGELILDDKKYIKHSKEAEGFLIQDNDLLMARTGATFAKVLLYNGDEPSVFASYLIRIKFKEKIKNALYWYFTKTKYYWEQANSLQSGAAQPHFNGAAVKQVIFSYPKSTKEQKVLIEKFETLSVETKKLEAIYQSKINDLEELKKSVLQKAFSGELKTATAVV
jgi:type I restriction enzyme S subunit